MDYEALANEFLRIAMQFSHLPEKRALGSFIAGGDVVLAFLNCSGETHPSDRTLGGRKSEKTGHRQRVDDLRQTKDARERLPNAHSRNAIVQCRGDRFLSQPGVRTGRSADLRLPKRRHRAQRSAL